MHKMKLILLITRYRNSVLLDETKVHHVISFALGFFADILHT